MYQTYKKILNRDQKKTTQKEEATQRRSLVKKNEEMIQFH